MPVDNAFREIQFKNGYETRKVDPSVHAHIHGTMNSIDWSKDRIALWVPGTFEGGVDGAFASSVQRPDTSVAAIRYPADTRFTEGSVGAGVTVLKAVLERAAAEGKQVVIGGHSQGAWVAGEALADRHASRAVDKAVLFGMPSVASHQYDAGQDPRVREVNNRDDPYANPMADGARLVEAVSRAAAGQAGDLDVLDTLARSVPQNGAVAAELVSRPFASLGGPAAHGYHRGSQGGWLNS